MNWRQVVVDLCNEHKITRYCEIGVKRADLSMKVASEVPTLEAMYLIDPWLYKYSDPEIRQSARGAGSSRSYPKTSQIIEDRNYYKTLRRMAQYTDIRVHVIKMTSDDAAVVLPDSMFDFVLIDGLHTEQAVWNDIQNYKKKLVPGGILAGDDYHDDFPGLVRSVDKEGGWTHLPAKRYPRRIWWKKV